MLVYNMECIICLEEVYENYIITNCCNKIIHEECLKTWIQTNIHKNTDISLCFYCKKNNTYISNIINETNEQNNQFVLSIVETNNNLNQTQNNNKIIIIIKILIFFLTIMLSGILFIVFIVYV